MMPWKRELPLTSFVIEIFNEIHGEAREKAIATGNYDSLLKQREREPGEDLIEDVELDSAGSQA